MGFMTLSIYISIRLVGGGEGLITQGSHWCPHSQRAHTIRHTQIRWCFSALVRSPADTWPGVLTRTCTLKSTDTYRALSPSANTQANLSTFTWSFLARLQWEAGEKCTGETETSCSACWHSQRVKGRQSGLYWPLWAKRSEQFDWQPAVYKRPRSVKG